MLIQKERLYKKKNFKSEFRIRQILTGRYKSMKLKMSSRENLSTTLKIIGRFFFNLLDPKACMVKYLLPTAEVCLNGKPLALILLNSNLDKLIKILFYIFSYGSFLMVVYQDRETSRYNIYLKR